MCAQLDRDQLMVQEGILWGQCDYIAISPDSEVVAWASTWDRANCMAIARGVSTPVVIPAWLCEQNLLQKAR